jgi:hypothetical protein
MATFFRFTSCYFLTLLLAEAHAISVSVAEGTLDGRALDLKLRIPRYEAEHLGKQGGTAAEAIARAFRFAGAQAVAQSCTGDGGDLVCLMSFGYAVTPGEKLEAEVRLARETVPNHVHILRVKRGGVERQAIFDRTFEREAIDFHQATGFETWMTGVRLGAGQLLYQPVLVALLLTMALVGRAWVYAPVLAASFLVVLPDKFYATPAFFELATAIGVAYFAVEGYFFPEARGRWIPLAVLGALEGAALAVLARPTGNAAVSYGFGNWAAQAGMLAAAVWGVRRMAVVWRRYVLLALAIGGGAVAIGIAVSRF